MEILLGMILLLQVLMSIQIMLFRKQMLQQLEKQEQSFETIGEEISNNKVTQGQNSQEKINELLIPLGEGKHSKVSGKEEQELLINEVLSEVFS